MAIMMSTRGYGEVAQCGGQQRKNSHRPSRCQWIFAGACWPLPAKDGVCAGRLSGTGFGDDQDDNLVGSYEYVSDCVTDVADRFPDRARKDGRYYAIDFTLDEIKSLKFTEGFDIENGKVQTLSGAFQWVSPTRYTFEEEIEFVQG